MVFSRELPTSFAEALKQCRDIISANQDLIRKGVLETEAEQLVIGAHRIATGEKLSRSELMFRVKDAFPEKSGERLLIFSGQRSEGVPLQHILGWQVFLNHEYEVSASALIPRPETEVLVSEAIRRLEKSSPKFGLEVGLGSGVISIELLHAFPGLKMAASEISSSAIDLAKKNAHKILESPSDLKIIHARKSDSVLEAFRGVRKADFFISNPPYLDATLSETESEVLNHEPKEALFPEGDPLHFYREFAKNAGELLRADGSIFLEIASERADATEALFKSRWKTKQIADLTGRPRVLIAGPLSEE